MLALESEIRDGKVVNQELTIEVSNLRKLLETQVKEREDDFCLSALLQSQLETQVKNEASNVAKLEALLESQAKEKEDEASNAQLQRDQDAELLDQLGRDRDYFEEKSGFSFKPLTLT